MADVRGQLREFALSLPGASEDFPWRERVVKATGKVFVFLGHDDESGPPGMTVKLVESRGHALALEGAEPSGYGLGRAGWVNVPLEAEGVSLDLLRDWVEESYRIIAAKRLVAELDRRSDSRSDRQLGRRPGRVNSQALEERVVRGVE